MSDEAPTQIRVCCKICGQEVLVDYTPSEFISENFVRNAFICSRHGKQRQEVRAKSTLPEASLPYKDS